MVQMATGAIDAAGIPGTINGDAAAGAVSMSMGAIIKRHKRTLINFQESFLIPMIEKTAWRYMQYDPDNYPVSDYKFIPSSSLGVIAREYEVTQLVQLLQTLGQDSPLYPMLVTAVIDNMGLSNREEIIAQMAEVSKPDPAAQEAAQQQQQLTTCNGSSATYNWFKPSQWRLKREHRNMRSRLNLNQRSLRLRWLRLSLTTSKLVTLTMLSLRSEHVSLT
jgi:hypothetical protein